MRYLVSRTCLVFIARYALTCLRLWEHTLVAAQEADVKWMLRAELW